MFASGFSWFRLIPAIDHDTLLHRLGFDEHTVVAGHEVASTTVHAHAWLAVAAVVAFAIAARLGLEAVKRRQGIERYFTSDRLTALSFAEVFVGGIKGMMGDLLEKKDVRLFFPLIAGLFLYIFACNIQSIFPGFLPPTDQINTNVGMALASTFTFLAVGLLRDPVGFIKHLAGPALFLAPFMFPIEVISLMIRPLSLTIRLTANLYGDHQVFTVITGLMQPFPIIVPALLLVLACLVSVVQAFVFSLLTVIYINLSLPHHEHDDHGHGDGHAHAH
jgi:F-type H+-transporting ATPase subunit a